MSRYIANPNVAAYVKKLREQSSPKPNDNRYAIYVRYINGFCSYFGRERVLLVGSTAEKLKLRWSKNGGDADYIMISGKVKIPVECLEFRTATPCFVWIKGKCLHPALNVDLVDGTYLPADMLQVVGPEAFTIMRGLHKIITSSSDGVPGSESQITTTGVKSNVGLARTVYRGLRLSEDAMSYIRRELKRQKLSGPTTGRRTTTTAQKRTTEKEKLWNILKFIGKLETPGSSGDHGGQFRNFAHIVHNLMESTNSITNSNGNPDKRQYINDLDLSSDEESTNGSKYANDLDTSSDEELERWTTFKSKNMSSTSTKKNMSENKKPSTFEATYVDKSSQDFVPAFLIDGRLSCMDDYRNRRHMHWPSPANVEEIYNCELYVVSKLAPVNGNPSKDFCLSFNQAELKLSECLSPVQRDVLLILKSYLKGTIENYSDKLTTFHLKTALYWVSETNDPEIWREDSIIEAVRIVLQFIRDCLVTKDMQHYFLPSNIFAGLNGHFRVLIEAIDYILADPIACIKAFFDSDDDKPVTLFLDEKQMQCLVQLYNDGGKQQRADLVEDALNDFQRGFDEGKKDANGESPINEAIFHVGQLYLKDEGNARVVSEVDRSDLLGDLAKNGSEIAIDFLSQIGNTVQERNEADTGRSMALAAEGGVGSEDSDIVEAALGLVGGESGRRSTTTQGSTEGDLIDTLGEYLINRPSDRRERQALEEDLFKSINHFFGKNN